MVTGTKNSIDVSLKSNNTSMTSKSASELYKYDKSSATAKAETDKSKDFNKVLSSKANSKDENADKVDKTDKADKADRTETSVQDKDTDKVDELKEKLEELEEKSESGSKDEINDILSEIINLLNKLGVNENDVKLGEKVNSDNIANLIQEIKGNETSDNSLSGIMEKLMKLLQTDSVKESLNTDSLKLMQKILDNLGNSMADDSTETAKDIKNSIKDLTSQISNILDNKQNQGGKILSLEDMLNKNYSSDNNESSMDNKSNNTTTSDESKKVSKEDKFLNSLLDEDKDNSLNKINLFASRTQNIQNQNVDATTRGLTINKATFVDDLIKDVKFMSNNGLKELTVKINPGNLGEITIKLIEEDGIMKANLKANSKETTALLAQNLAEIKNHLNEQNIKIAHVNIDIYQDDTTFFSGEGFNSELSKEQQKNSDMSNGKNDGINIEDSLVEDTQTIDNGNVNFLA